MERNLRLKIDWASLIIWKEIYRFSLFYFVFEGDFQVQALWGTYIWRGDLTEGFLSWECGGAYIWRGLYMEGQGKVACAVCLKPRASKRLQSKPALRFLGLFAVDFLIRKHP